VSCAVFICFVPSFVPDVRDGAHGERHDRAHREPEQPVFAEDFIRKQDARSSLNDIGQQDDST